MLPLALLKTVTGVLLIVAGLYVAGFMCYWLRLMVPFFMEKDD